jgi:hypothetical protein
MNSNLKKKLTLLRDYLRTHWFAALLAGIFIVVLGVWYWTRGWGTPEPAPPPPPAEIQPTFGKLPPIEPRSVAITSPNLVTYAGSPRITEPQTAMAVYPYSNTWMREPEVLAIAEELRLRTAPMRKGSLLTWSQGEEHLSADLEKGYFEYSVSFADEVEEWGNITLPDRGKLEEIMENRMENLLPSSLAGQLKLEDIRYYGISGNHLVPVENVNNGQIAEGIFRRNLDNYGVYSDNPESGVAGLQVSPIRKTVRIRFSLKPLNMIQKAVYPLRTVEEAWQDLQAGKGFLV